MTTDSFTVVANRGYVTAHHRADCPALRHAPNRTHHANFDSLAVALVMSDGRPWPCGHCWPATMKPAGFRHWLANLALAAARALADREREDDRGRALADRALRRPSLAADLETGSTAVAAVLARAAVETYGQD